MKKALLFLSVLIILGFAYSNLITSIYTHIQAKSICKCINKGSVKENPPAVGPSALEHLTWLNEETKGEYICKVINETYDMPNDSKHKTILISENGVEKIRLRYYYNFGDRSILLPIYYHHETNFEHEHKNHYRGL